MAGVLYLFYTKSLKIGRTNKEQWEMSVNSAALLFFFFFFLQHVIWQSLHLFGLEWKDRDIRWVQTPVSPVLNLKAISGMTIKARFQED